MVFSREKRENLRGCARCLLAEDEIPVNKWEGKDTPTRVVLLVLIQERNTRGTVNVAETRDLTFPHRRRGYTRRSSWRRISPACSLGAHTPSSDAVSCWRQFARCRPFPRSRAQDLLGACHHTKRFPCLRTPSSDCFFNRDPFACVACPTSSAARLHDESEEAPQTKTEQASVGGLLVANDCACRIRPRSLSPSLAISGIWRSQHVQPIAASDHHGVRFVDGRARAVIPWLALPQRHVAGRQYSRDKACPTAAAFASTADAGLTVPGRTYAPRTLN